MEVSTMTQLLDRVASAQSEAEVIQTAAEYVDTWSPPDLAKLPAPCRPGRRLDAGDIIFLAVSLKQECELRTDSGLQVNVQLRAMAEFFRAAAHRIRRLGMVRTAG
jgi:hypothetical protein